MIKIPRRATLSEKRPVVISSEIHLLKRISPLSFTTIIFYDLPMFYIKILQAFVVCEELVLIPQHEQMAHTCPSPQDTHTHTHTFTGIVSPHYVTVHILLCDYANAIQSVLHHNHITPPLL